MSTATSPWKFSTAIAATAVIFGLAGCFRSTGTAVAQSMPDSEKGRYSMSTVGNGVIRLDTRTGAVSTCNNGPAGWACYAVPDERAALDVEIGRLQADNEKLKKELASREPVVTGKTEEPMPKSDPLKKSEPKIAEGERKLEIRCRATATWSA